MIKVGTCNGYDFYIDSSLGERMATYNIVPEGSEAPTGGYYTRTFIEAKKGIRFPALYNYNLWSSMTDEEKIKDCLLYNTVFTARYANEEKIKDAVRRLQGEDYND